MPKVSVIIPTYNRLEQLKAVLAGFEAQSCDLKEIEVIVTSDGSTDGTDAYLESARFGFSLELACQQNAGPAAARNLGVKKARGQLILFIDDDVVPDTNLIQEHLITHAQLGENAVVLGPMLSPANFRMAPWVNWEQMMLYKQYADMEAGQWEPTARQFYTGNASVRREHLEKAGGFDVTFRRAEDVELAYRLADAGLRFVFNSKAIGFHYVSRTFTSWMQTPYLYGKHDVIFSQKKGQEWLIPTVMKEFHSRHQFIKSLVKSCLSQSMPSRTVVFALKQAAGFSDLIAKIFPTVGLLSRFAYSGIYNLTYYQGIADELGGRQQFLALVDEAARS